MSKFSCTFDVNGMTEEQINERKRFANTVINTYEKEIEQVFMIANGMAHYDWRGRFVEGKESQFSLMMRRIKRM